MSEKGTDISQEELDRFLKDHQDELAETKLVADKAEAAELEARVKAIFQNNPPLVSTDSQASLTQAEVNELLNKSAAAKPPGS
jgi:hypothetical protein